MDLQRYPIEDQISVVPMLMSWIRRALGLTQEEMAKRIGVSPEEIDSYESGESLPNQGIWLYWTMAVMQEIKAAKEGT